MKKFLAYLISTSIICSPINAKPPLEHIKDLDTPLIGRNKGYLSIAVGADNRYIRGVRDHGNYSAKKSSFPCVEHNQLKEDDRPQDPVTAVLQRFFPSPLHDALVPNNLQQDQLKKWLTPECGAHIINHIDDNEKFSQLSNEEQVLGIVKALTPNAYWTEALKAPMQAKLTKQSETKVLYSRLQGRDSFKFANLFVQAIKQSRNPSPEDEYLYDPHIIETALLTYIWQQAQEKQDFEPYYKTLSKDIADKTIAIDFQSFYTKDDYFNLKENIESEIISIEEFMLSPEKMTLLTQGSSYYEDPLPPSSSYGSVLFQEADGKNYIYTNCGENALMDWLNMVMFDPEQRSFAYAQKENLTAKGLFPLKEFTHFYKEIQIYPHQSNLQKTLNAWSQLVGKCNILNDSDPIHYLKKQGVRVKKGTMDGNYELGNGLHNLLRVVGKFLNDPLWQPMKQKDKTLLTAIQGNLDRFCTLFSRENFLLDWKVKDTNNKEIKKSTDITIAFSVDGEDRFDLTCGCGHFHLDKNSQTANEEFFGEVGSEIIPYIKQWNPLYLNFIKAMTIIDNEYCELDIKKIINVISGLSSIKKDIFFSSYLYSKDLNNIDEKLQAIEEIHFYKEKFNNNGFNKIFSRWITQKGEHFGYWEDPHTNFTVLDSLASFNTIEEIKKLNIEKFNHILQEDQVVKTISFAASGDCKNVARMVLQQPGILEQHKGEKFFDEDDSSEVDEESLDEGSLNEDSSNEDSSNEELLDEGNSALVGLSSEENSSEEESSSDKKSEKDNSTTLLHHIASLGLDEFITPLLIESLEVKNSEGMTPLLCAAEAGHKLAAFKLIELGANIEACNREGYKPLHLAIQSGHIDIIEKLTELGASSEVSDSLGSKLLLNAIRCGVKKDTVKHLLSHLKFDVNFINKKEEHTPIVFGDLEGSTQIAHGEYLENSPLLEAILYGNLDIVELLLAHSKIDVNVQDKNGGTAFSSALCSNHPNKLSMLKCLLSHEKIEPNIPNQWGIIPFIQFVSIGDVESLQFLLSHPKIDVNVQDKNGGTALSQVLHSHSSLPNKLSILKCLLSHEKIDLNLATAFEILFTQGTSTDQQEVIELLLSHPKIDVNTVDKEGNTPFSKAMAYGCENIVKILLNNDKFNPNISTPYGTPLTWACGCGKEDIVEVCLAHPKIDVNAIDQDGTTPLSKAVSYGNEDIVKLLLAHPKIDVNATDNNGNTPLSKAMSYGKDDMVKLLLSHEKIDPNISTSYGTPLTWAISSGKQDIVELLLSHPKIDVNAVDKDGNTPFWKAINYNSMELVELIMTHDKFNPNIRDTSGNTPLSAAIARGKQDIVRRLLSHPNIDVNATDKDGNTPLLTALHYYYGSGKDMAKLLLSHPKIDVNAVDKDGNTPLGLSVKNSNIDFIKIILTKDYVDVNSRNNDQKSPLLMAISSSNKLVPKLMLSCSHIDVNAADKEENTPLMMAIKNYWDKDTTKLLVSHPHIDINAEDKDGNTALSFAINSGWADIVKILLSNDTLNPNVVTKKGTPMEWAINSGYKDIVETLLSHPNIDVNLPDKDGNTTLSKVINRYGWEHIVKLLFSHPNIDVNEANKYSPVFLSKTVNSAKQDRVEIPSTSSKTYFAIPTSYGTSLPKPISDEGQKTVKLPQSNIDVNAYDIYGNTILTKAIKSGKPDMVEPLLAHPNIDVNMADKLGDKPLAKAMNSGYLKIVKLLLSHEKTDYDVITIYGVPLFWAVTLGHQDILETVLSASYVDVNAIDNEGNTPLLKSIKYACKEGIIKTLLSHPLIDVNAIDKEGHTPLTKAIKFGHKDIVKLLLSHSKIEPNLKGSNGDSPLHLAVKAKSVEMVRMLLEKGADIHVLDKEGHKPLFLARSTGMNAVGDLLRQAHQKQVAEKPEK